MNRGLAIHITGTVQGVGFRPWVWQTAHRMGLKGTVRNSLDGVRIELYGATDPFLHALQSEPPPLSRIDSIRTAEIKFIKMADFRILESENCGESLLHISADISICDECRAELFDAGNRRHRYPFINCVNCGPRFSIIEALPYDRARTSMKSFEMCPACRNEYEDPSDRRYHAQPVACPDCGPQMAPTDWEAVWRESMEQGKIVAVKGIGGFHLACDALNPDAVKMLRRRKGRENKPFALMVPDLEWVRAVCEPTADEEKLLCSRERPIVILKLKHVFEAHDDIAPGLDTLAVMLPYSPMHEVMFDLFSSPVVMTSANYSSDPMIHTNEDAKNKLKDIADVFLMHDRAIVNRCDDAVCSVFGEQTIVIRPGRGIAPVSMPVPQTSGLPWQGRQDAGDTCVLSCGADMKNTFALAHHGHITLHPYVGDLEHPQTQAILEKSIKMELECFKLQPGLVVHDLHPDYFSAGIARSMADGFGVPAIAVQHHHAHLAGAYPGKAIGFAFDGTGYGTDGTIWGGEVLLYDVDGFSREVYLRPFALPGGDTAVKDPRRICESILYQINPARVKSKSTLEQLESGINCPMTSSIGRLFDAVSCLLGVCEKPTYDGEAAMRLEAAADPAECGDLAFQIQDREIDWRPLISDLLEELDGGVPVSILATRFHNTLAEIVYCCGKQLSGKHGKLPWVFAGGVFQNRLLVDRIRKVVGDEFELVFSSYPNDSGIAVGQIIIGARQWALK